MKKHTILIKLSQFNLEATKITKCQMIEIADYVLRPFVQLNTFSYNNYTDEDLMIDGLGSPNLFFELIDKWLEHQTRLMTVRNEVFYSQNITNIELKEIQLSVGVYSYESMYLNTLNNSSILTSNNLHEIRENTSDYVILFTNVFK